MPPEAENIAAEAPQDPAATIAPEPAQEPPAAAADAPAPVPEVDPAAAAIDHKVSAWLYGHIAGGPIARNTDCWNALQAALPALRAELLKGD
jgi:hypothetical protein